MSDKELNFGDLFESHKSEQNRTTSVNAADEDRKRPLGYAHYIENPGNLRIKEPIPKAHRKPSVNHAQLRQFKRTQKNWNNLGTSLDLHGYNKKTALKVLISYIEQCQYKKVPYLLVIFGKGLSSPGEPVLKKTICSFLIECPEVLAYEFAKPKDGGDGAAYVMLKKR